MLIFLRLGVDSVVLFQRRRCLAKLLSCINGSESFHCHLMSELQGRVECTQASEGGFVTQQILNYKYLPVRTETVSNSEAEMRLDRKSRDSSAFWEHQQSSDQTISGI